METKKNFQLYWKEYGFYLTQTKLEKRLKFLPLIGREKEYQSFVQ